MLHPWIRDFDQNDARVSTLAWVCRRFPKFVDRKGIEDQFESAVTHIFEAQERLAAALEFQLLDRSVRLTQKQRQDQAKDLWKSQDVEDESGARDAALRVVTVKPPAMRWRRKLQRLRADTGRLLQDIADRDIRDTIRLGALREGILDESGPRWLHYLRDNPNELRRAIDTALNDPLLRGDVGRPDERDFVNFVVEVIEVCRDLTGHSLSHKVRLKGDSRAGVPSMDADDVVSPDILLVQDLLAPFGSQRNADNVSYLIRKARKHLKSRKNPTT